MRGGGARTRNTLIEREQRTLALDEVVPTEAAETWHDAAGAGELGADPRARIRDRAGVSPDGERRSFDEARPPPRRGRDGARRHCAPFLSLRAARRLRLRRKNKVLFRRKDVRGSESNCEQDSR